MKTADKAKPSTQNKLTVVEKDGKSQNRILAELGLSPIVANTLTAVDFSKGSFGELNLTESVDIMGEKVNKVNAGDLSDVEATLTAQAVTLDAIFNGLARRASHNMGTSMAATEIYLRMAFKAQAQCRSTLEALAEVKNPRQATFVRQQNIANQQQVNNGARPPAKDIRTQGSEKQNTSNQLLEQYHGERLDTRTQSTTSGAYPHMATLEAIDRAQD